MSTRRSNKHHISCSLGSVQKTLAVTRLMFNGQSGNMSLSADTSVHRQRPSVETSLHDVISSITRFLLDTL